MHRLGARVPSPYNLRGVPYGTACTVRPAHGRVHHAPGPAGSVASLARPRGGHVCVRCPAMLRATAPNTARGLWFSAAWTVGLESVCWLGLRLVLSLSLSLTVTGYRRRVHTLLPSINLENQYKSRSNSNLPLPVTKKRLQDPLSLTSTDKTWTRSCGYPPSLEAWALRSMAGKKACSDSSLQAC